MSNEAREHCAVVGVANQDNAALVVRDALFALQHRGHDGSGIASSDGSNHYWEGGSGYVEEALTDEKLKKLPGNVAIGHNRYSTSGGDGHPQPVRDGDLALAHNGTIPDPKPLGRLLDSVGVNYAGKNDSEMVTLAFGHFLKTGALVEDAYGEVRPYIPGVYSLTVIYKGQLSAIRCEYGVRPEVFGRRDDSYMVASETCALDATGFNYVGDIMPGSMVKFTDNGPEVFKFTEPKYKLDIFETIYFSWFTSMVYNRVISDYRQDYGEQLARELKGISADLIIPVYNSGKEAAIGFSRESHIPMPDEDKPGLRRNKEVGRTFITAGQSNREAKVREKFTADSEVVNGKSIIVVDDSIVKGTTSPIIVEMLRLAGAREVTMAIASPMVLYPNFYGIDTPIQSELLAFRMNFERMRQHINVDRLAFLSIDGLKSTLGPLRDLFDFSCLDGNYPVDIGERAKEIVRVNDRVLITA